MTSELAWSKKSGKVISKLMKILRLATAGSVDDGKSTLIARLLLDTNSLPDDLKPSEHSSSSLANLLDGLDIEREQGITIDVAHRFFDLDGRRYHIMDSPGHEQYTRNMATAASGADVLLLLVSANEGVKPQTLNHLRVATFVGIKKTIIVVNKLDLVKKPAKAFRSIRDYLIENSNLSNQNVEFVGVVALSGENVVKRSQRLCFDGSRSLLQALQDAELDAQLIGRQKEAEPEMISIQAVMRGERRVYLGEVLSGVISEHSLLASSGNSEHVNLQDLHVSGRPAVDASSGSQISFTLSREVDLARGDILSKAIIQKETAFSADLIWLDSSPGFLKRRYLIQIGQQKVAARITKIKSLELDGQRIDISGGAIPANSKSRVEVFASSPLVFLENELSKLSKFILIDPELGKTLAAGRVVHTQRKSQNVVAHQFDVTPKTLADRLGFIGRVIWLTGLSASGKSTLANAIAIELANRGVMFSILDGDSLRLGLNKDLGFTDSDRIENIRRTAEVAKILVDSGLVAIVALVSPFRSDREDAKEIIGQENFIEVFVSTPLEICEKRDPKGLYKKARSGSIPNFTGIQSRYEPPISPDIEINSALMSPESGARKVIQFFSDELE